MKNVIKKIAYTICFLVAIVLFVKIFFPYYLVATDSKQPEIPEGVVIVSRFYYKIFSPKQNDILMLAPTPSVPHGGVYEKTPWVYKMRSDALPSAILKDDILGKVIFHF